MLVSAGLAVSGCRDSVPEDPVGPRYACQDLPRPQLPESIAFEPAFEHVVFEEGVALAHRPGDDSRRYLVTKPGVVYTFTADEGPDVFVDIRDRVETASEAGLLGIAFHPDFASNGEVFLSYTTPGTGRFVSRISRMTSPDGGLTLDPDSETVVLALEQPYANHNGGDIHFGPDGMLYIGFGDGGAGSDPHGHGQDPTTQLAAMLRIDVDGGDPYAIPPDNPFASGGGAPEIYATGLRNPWRFNFDVETGELWVGDVGQNQWEEVDVVSRGDNLGWNVKEGAECFGRDDCADPTLVEPVAQYRNTGGATVVGGHVYYGTALPELDGAFVYSDYYTGRVWAVRRGQTPQVLHRSGGRRVAAWARDEAGELYGVVFGGGIVRMVAAPEAGPDDFPRVLSDSGCVLLDDPTAAAPGTIAYDVALPFWSDGADKLRWLSVPEGERLTVGDDGDFVAPVGTTLVKTFLREGAPIETRLFVRHDDGGWAGYSYAWRGDGSDADFVPEGQDAGAGATAWHFPAIEDCSFCHTDVAGGSLGLETAQLAVTIETDEGPMDQLDHWVALGLLDARPPGTVHPGEQAPIADRARAYLHVNCSQCHRPDGPSGRALLDLRVTTPLAETGLCDPPRAGDGDLPGLSVLVPGDAASSVLPARMRSVESLRMPPIGSGVVDVAGVELLETWIDGLPSCP